MKIAITGATGFVGTKLVEKLAKNHQIIVLTRSQEKAKKIFPNLAYPNLEIVTYTPTKSGDWQNKIDGCNGVINLAGAPVGEKWTENYKKTILDSRQLATQKIVEAIEKANSKPQTLINASAIGYYGTSETETFTETSPSGNDFLAKVSQLWEEEANKVKELGVRLVIFRFGIVLGNGGALAKMVTPFKMFAGGPLGDGKQWFSWIHRHDLVSLIIKALENNNIEGTFNATAPNPVKMNELCQQLGDVMNRPSWLPVPSFALDLLLGDGSKLVLEGQKVLPQKTQKNINFKFQYPTLKPALLDIIKNEF